MNYKKILFIIIVIFVIAFIAIGITIFVFNNASHSGETKSEWLIVSAEKSGNKWDIWLLTTDLKEQINLTQGRGSVDRASFSRDGKKIIFGGNFGEGWQIYTITPDGSNLRKLTSLSENGFPVFTPDGTKIIFQCNAGDGPNICAMNADGTNIQTLTTTKSDTRPNVSPDSKKIVFQSKRDDGHPELYLMNIDGTNQERLTENKDIDAWASFSPNGEEIVFESSRDAPTETTRGDIYIMTLADKKIRRITYPWDNPACQRGGDSNIRPSFSPDGKKIVFIGQGLLACKAEILIIDSAGGKPRQITKWGIKEVDSPSFAPLEFRR